MPGTRLLAKASRLRLRPVAVPAAQLDRPLRIASTETRGAPRIETGINVEHRIMTAVATALIGDNKMAQTLPHRNVSSDAPGTRLHAARHAQTTTRIAGPRAILTPLQDHEHQIRRSHLHAQPALVAGTRRHHDVANRPPAQAIEAHKAQAASSTATGTTWRKAVLQPMKNTTRSPSTKT